MKLRPLVLLLSSLACAGAARWRRAQAVRATRAGGKLAARSRGK